MIRINLLPFRAARKKENVRRQLTFFTLSVVLVIAALIFYNSLLSNQVQELEEGVNNSKIELAQYQKKNKEVALLEKKLKILKQKIQVIEGLDASREDAVRLMDKMTEVMVPGRMWLSSFSAMGNGVKVSGTAVDNKTVADYMTNLQSVKQFSAVNLKQTAQTAFKADVFFKNFSINFTRTQMKPIKEEDKAQK